MVCNLRRKKLGDENSAVQDELSASVDEERKRWEARWKEVKEENHKLRDELSSALERKGNNHLIISRFRDAMSETDSDHASTRRVGRSRRDAPGERLSLFMRAVCNAWR